MGTGKKKIEIKRMEKEEQRMVTFSKRRQGLFKKAHQLHSLTGANLAVVAFSPAGRPYTHGEPSFDALIDHYQNITQDDEEDHKAKANELRSWLDAVKIEANEDMEELLFFKKEFQRIVGKVAKKIDGNLYQSLLV